MATRGENAPFTDAEWMLITEALIEATDSGRLRWSILDHSKHPDMLRSAVFTARVGGSTIYRLGPDSYEGEKRIRLEILGSRPGERDQEIECCISGTVGRDLVSGQLQELLHTARRSAAGAPQMTVAALVAQARHLPAPHLTGCTSRDEHELANGDYRRISKTTRF